MVDIGGEKRWDKNIDFDWHYIEEQWFRYWDIRKTILLEKSPGNTVRAQSIERHFCPAYFLIITRSPCSST